MLNLLRSERGIALPLALAVMFVLSISVLAVVQYNGANARNASLTFAGQNAKGIAEAGVNHGAAALARLIELNGSTYTASTSGTATVADGGRT